MTDDAWWLKEIGDFIYLLNCYGPDEKDVLQRRFKKAGKAFNMLYDLLESFDKLGFDGTMQYGRDSKRIETVTNNIHLTLIEIRIQKTLWRVLTHVDYEKKIFVMIDAFENHKKKTVNEVVKENRAKIRIAMELLKEVE